MFLSATSIFTKNAGGVTPPSASTYTTVTYSGSKIMDIFKPTGYDDAINSATNYPLIVYFPGYGSTDRPGGSFSNRNNVGEGLGQFLTSGDSPPGVLICCPQNLIVNTDYGHAEWDAALTYMVANFRVNTNRQYSTGLSGGAIACQDIFNVRTNCAGVVSVSGPSFTSNWATIGTAGFGFWQHHGTTDATFGLTIGGTLYQAGGASGSAIDLTPAPRTTYYFGLGHVAGVWDTNVYNRLERTDATGTAQFDFVRFLKKFSLDLTEQATQFTSNAEFSVDIVDYREALALVNNLSSGAPKTALLARLATLKTTIDRSGIRYIVSANNPFITVSQTGINDWNATFAATQGLSNIVDDGGGASAVSFTVTNQFASTGRDNNAGDNNAGRQKFKGFKLEYNLSGIVISNAITNGRLTFTGIPSGKLTDILIHHYHLSGDGDNPNPITAQSALSATANSITQTQYSEYENGYYMKFTNVPESSGSFTLDMKTVSTKDVVVTGFELVIHS